MDKIMDFPAEYAVSPELTALYDAQREARAAVQEVTKELDAALKSQKRSPLKWTPIVADLQNRLAPLADRLEAAQSATEVRSEADREARREAAMTVTTAVLETLGTSHLIAEYIPSVRVAIAGVDTHEILAYANDPRHIIVALVPAGTDQRVFGYEVTVYGPETRYSDGVKPAHLSNGSYSGLDTNRKVETMNSVRHIALMLSVAWNEAYGLEEPTDIC